MSNSYKPPENSLSLRACWLLALLLGCALPASAQMLVQADADEVQAGRRIYIEGVLPAGAELTGTRFGRIPVAGSAAACVNCHRPSGMGQVEAEVLIPPISGNFLFATRRDKRLATMDPHVSKLFNQAHDPYTEVTLAAAIRDGVNSQGRTMSAAMPHFQLDDAQLKAVTAYLKQLSAEWSPGVTQNQIRFATVITPDVDPLRRKVMIDMMRTIFRQKNGSTLPASQSHTRHHMTTAAELILGTERRWSLDIWELQGAPETWGQQLSALYRAQPVFALVSGLSSSTWQPVHDFCRNERVPCWFPSVDVPGRTTSPYAFYFSDGVSLEAAALARHLVSQGGTRRHLVQIRRDDHAGRTAAQAMTQALSASGIAATEMVLPSGLAAVDALRQALGRIKPDDIVMFWLRPDDIRALGELPPVSRNNYFSAQLGKGDRTPLNAAWRARSHLVYPYELPQNRTKNLNYFQAWLNLSKIPLVDEAMQSEVFFAMNFMTDTLSEMLDNLYRDYLLERAETMLSVREGIKSEQETRDRLFLGREGDLVRKRGPLTIDESLRIPITGQQDNSSKSLGTTLYPHLGLGPEQRLASKAAYIVRFADDSGPRLTAVSDLIVP